MPGQLIQRGERTWLVRVYLGRDPRTGKRRYLNKTIHGNKKAAQTFLNDALTKKGRRLIPGPISERALIQNHFRPAIRAAEVREIRLYDLRHTCATMLLASGVHPKVVSERLGHASVQITLDIYSHVLPTIQEEASKVLDRDLFSGKDPAVDNSDRHTIGTQGKLPASQVILK